VVHLHGRRSGVVPHCSHEALTPAPSSTSTASSSLACTASTSARSRSSCDAPAASAATASAAHVGRGGRQRGVAAPQLGAGAASQLAVQGRGADGEAALAPAALVDQRQVER
jgi:hypothetical protein